MRFVEMIETPSNIYGLTARKREINEAERRKPILINPEQVAAITPHDTYTTLAVAGHYIHVAHPYEAVLEMLRVTGVQK